MSVVDLKNLSDNFIVNTPRRCDFQNKSFFYKLSHPVEKKAADYEFFTEILTYLDTNFRINDLQETRRIWDFVLKSRKISWQKEDDCTGKKFKEIYAAFEEALVYSGKGVDCPLTMAGDVGAMCGLLLAKEGGLPLSFFRWENLKRIVIERDEAYLAQFRGALQNALHQGLASFQAGQVSEVVFKSFTYNILALLPFTYPNNQPIQVPVNVDGNWEMVDYRIDKKFVLSPSWFSEPLPAWGFLSDHPKAPPLLTCIGTTYPAGDGFMTAVLSDFTPGFSVGQAATWYSEKEMALWLEGKTGVHVTGVSLGGATALHVSRLHTGTIGEVHAFNPAGLYPWNWSGIQHEHINYHIYSNENDLVSTMGVFPEGKNVKFYRLLAESENFLSSHVKVYTAAERVSMIRTPPQYENARPERQALTALHVMFSWVVFIVVLPFHLLFRMGQFIYSQISRLCYNVFPREEVGDATQLLRSSTTNNPASV